MTRINDLFSAISSIALASRSSSIEMHAQCPSDRLSGLVTSNRAYCCAITTVWQSIDHR